VVGQRHTSHNKVLPAPRPLRVRSDLHGPERLWRGSGVARILRKPVCERCSGGHVGNTRTLADIGQGRAGSRTAATRSGPRPLTASEASTVGWDTTFGSGHAHHPMGSPLSLLPRVVPPSRTGSVHDSGVHPVGSSSTAPEGFRESRVDSHRGIHGRLGHHLGPLSPASGCLRAFPRPSVAVDATSPVRSTVRGAETSGRQRPLTKCCRLRSLRSLRPTWPEALVAGKRSGAYSRLAGS